MARSAAALPLQTSLFAPQAVAVSTKRCSMLWAALFFPRLSLEVLRADDDAPPWVVVHEQGGQQVVYAASASAGQLGVESGMALTAAYALCPHLESEQRDEAAEQACLVRLADWAGRYTSMVSLEPQALLLEVGASLTLFGGLEAIRARIKKDLQRHCHDTSMAFAPTPQAALLLARCGADTAVTEPQALRAVLGRLSLEALPVTTKQAALFARLGLRLLRDLWRLPTAGVAKRFGVDLVDYLDRLSGVLPEPRLAHQSRPVFSARWSFSLETDNMTFIYHGLAQLLPQLASFMRLRGLALNRLQLVFYHTQCPASRVELGMQQLSDNAGHIFKLLHERLAQVQLRAPVLELDVVADEFHASVPGNESLFDGADGPDGEWRQMLDQLHVRLGAQAVTGLQWQADHRPERATGFGPPLDGEALGERPLWLLPQPQRLVNGLKNITRESGPERIESGWWDGGDVRRDYYRARDNAGRRLWLFRHLDEGGWYLHGLFA